MPSTFENIKTLVYTLGPFALPYIYRSITQYREYSKTHKAIRKPVSRRIGLVLNLLFLATVTALIFSYLSFSYENVITVTGSRIQTPQNVLWERVASKRAGRTLTPLDERLRDRLASTDGRCLYLMYGPDVTGNCPFCSSDEPRTFFYYALPSIMLPHLINLVLLGLSTSINVAGKEGKRFRAQVVLVGCVFAAIEALVWLNYDWKANATAKKATDVFQFYGWARVARYAGIALIDAGLAWFLWATSTNRLMVIAPPARERIDLVLEKLQSNSSKITAAGVIKNTTVRTPEFHQRELDFWRQEDSRIQQAMAEESVKRAIQKARSHGRLDPEKLQQDAQRYAESMLPAAGVTIPVA